MFGEQHAVTEHVTGHVTDTDNREVLLLGIDAQMTEVPFDRFPRTTCGNAHFLVVVTGRATRRKGVAQPEAVRFGDTVGNVREGCRAFIGRDHQIRIIGIQTVHVGRRYDFAIDQIVGHVQQGGNEGPVAGNPFGHPRFAVGRRRQLLADEAAFGAHRDNHRVLDLLRLDQTQHFGTEVFHTVRPAQAATRHFRTAQVHAFDTRAVNPDFEQRTRLRQERNRTRLELEGHIRLEVAIGRFLPEIGTAGRQNHGQETVKDTVLVQIRHLVQQLAQFTQQGIGAGSIGLERRQSYVEQFHQTAGNGRVIGDTLLDIGLTEGQTGLAEVFGQCTHQRNLAPVQAGHQCQAVKAVIFTAFGEDLCQQFLKIALHRVAAHFLLTAADIQTEVTDPHQIIVATGHAIRMLVTHLDAHVFQNGQAGRQAERFTGAEQLEVEIFGVAMEGTIQLHRQRVSRTDRFEMLHVKHRIAYGKLFAIGQRERALVTIEQLIADFFAMCFDQLLMQLFDPATHQTGNLGFEIRFAHGRQDARRRTDDVVHPCQRFVADMHRKLGRLAIEGIDQHFLDFEADFGIEAVARYVYQAADITMVAVGTQEQAHARTLLQIDDADGGGRQHIGRDFQQFVARIAFQHEAQRLGLVAVVDVVATVDDFFDLATQDRNVFRRGLIGTGGIQTEETAFTDHFALVIEALDADKVDVGRAMNDGTGLRFVENDQLRQVGQFTQFLRQLFETGRVLLVALVLQDAQTRVLDDAQAVLAIAFDQIVIAIAHEQEVIVGHPAQEIDGFRGFGSALAIQRTQLADNVFQYRTHGRFVVDHQTNIRDETIQIGFQTLQRGGIRDAVHLHVNEGFQRQAAIFGAAHLDQFALVVAGDRQHRMHQQMQIEVIAGQEHGHRIDQERHVGGHDFNHAMGTLPAIAFEIRVIDARLVLADRQTGSKTEVGHRRAKQIQGGKTSQVAVFGLFEVDREEGVQGFGLLRRQFALGNCLDIGDQTRQLGLVGKRHLASLVVCTQVCRRIVVMPSAWAFPECDTELQKSGPHCNINKRSISTMRRAVTQNTDRNRVAFVI